MKNKVEVDAIPMSSANNSSTILSGLEDRNQHAKSGEWVLLRTNDGETHYFVEISKHSTLKLAKKIYPCNVLVGAAYGSHFEAIEGKLCPCDLSLLQTSKNMNQMERTKDLKETFLHDDIEQCHLPTIVSPSFLSDNKDFVDDNQAQKLSEKQISDIKRRCGGEWLVKALAQHSATFSKRTEFGQAKYLSKKSKKHRTILELLRPTSFSICRSYFMRKPYKTLNLREDCLANILALGNIQSGVSVALIDDCLGLLLGSIMDRLACRGSIYYIFKGQMNEPSAIRLWNFSEPFKAVLKQISLNVILGNVNQQDYLEYGPHAFDQPRRDIKLSSINQMKEDGLIIDKEMEKIDELMKDEMDDQDMKEGMSDLLRPNEKRTREEDNLDACTNKKRSIFDPSEIEGEKVDDIESNATVLSNEKVGEKVDEIEFNPSDSPNEMVAIKRRREGRLSRWRQLCTWHKELIDHQVDTLIIAGPSYPLTALQLLWPSLKRAGYLVIYCEYIEPLVDCFHHLVQTGETTNLRLGETWYRAYQVLPERTHPMMNTSSTSGYLLSAIKVEAPKVNARLK